MKTEHVGIYANDVNTLRRWYEDVLDMRVVRKLEREGRPPVFFLAGEGGLEIEILPTEARAPARPLTDPGYSHLGIVVNDFNATAELLRARGVELRDIRTTSKGWTIGYFDDPEGNHLEVVFRPDEG